MTKEGWAEEGIVVEAALNKGRPGERSSGSARRPPEVSLPEVVGGGGGEERECSAHALEALR